MPFFEVPEPEPAPRRKRRRRRTTSDPWARPADWIPRYLPLGFVLGASDRMAVCVAGVACYPRGFAFDLVSVSKYRLDYDEEGHFHSLDPFFPPHGRRREVPDTLLRFGVQYANGSKATNLDEDFLGFPSTTRRTGPNLGTSGGSGGSPEVYHHSMWVWPLPPDGPVTFACEWPAFGIPESLHRVPGARIRKAAEKSKPVF